MVTNIKSENLFFFKNELIDILIRILAIRSLTGYESELAAFILDFIKSFVNLNEVNVIKERNNIIVFNKEINLDKKNNQVLALVGHIDTVDNVNEYNLRVMDEKVYGLGSSDMKAGIAVMLVLLKYFYKFRNLIWIFYDQEEGSFINNGLNIVFSKYLDLIKNIDLAIILEPTDNYIELGCNGVCNVEVFYKGKSGHSARKYSYINPFYKIIPLLSKIQELPEFEAKVNILNKEIVFKSNFVITDIKGIMDDFKDNKFRNVVPEYAKLNLNIRFPFTFNKRDLISFINKFLYEVKVDIIKVVDYAPAGRIIFNNLLNDFINYYVKYFRDLRVKGKESYTDVSKFTNNSISAINFGPGSPYLAHQKNEYVLIPNFTQNFSFLYNFINSISFK